MVNLRSDCEEIINLIDAGDENEPIITLDADVVFMQPVDMMYSRVISTLSQGNCSQAFEDFDVAVLGMGSVHLFSALGLSRYAKYIHDLYSKDVSSTFNHAKKRGRRHYSDMDRMEEFVQEDRRLRSYCLTHYEFMPEESVDSVVGSWSSQKPFFEGIGCVVANTMRAFQKKTKAKILMNKLIEARSSATATNGTNFNDLVKVTGKAIPDNLSLCYLHFQGAHKRVSVQWTLVFLHLYEVYRRSFQQQQQLSADKLFLCKEHFTDVMYVDDDLVLREVGTLGVAPFKDIKGFTIQNENTNEDPLVLLGYFNVRLSSGEDGNGNQQYGRGKLVIVEDALYWMFRIGTALTEKEKRSLGV